MSGKLILTLDGNVVREFPLTGSSLLIGRRSDNDIQLNDLTVSGHHARVTRDARFVYVEDLDSTNGTLVNGYYIKKVALEHGNVVQIGHHQLTYLAEGKGRYQPTMFIKAEMDETQMVLPAWDLETETADAGTSPAHPLGTLRVLDGPMTNTVVELRKVCSSVGFQGHKLALISRGIDGYTVASVAGSVPGIEPPLLNGRRLPTEARHLEAGDVINIAGFNVEFRYAS